MTRLAVWDPTRWYRILPCPRTPSRSGSRAMPLSVRRRDLAQYRRQLFFSSICFVFSFAYLCAPHGPVRRRRMDTLIVNYHARATVKIRFRHKTIGRALPHTSAVVQYRFFHASDTGAMEKKRVRKKKNGIGSRTPRARDAARRAVCNFVRPSACILNGTGSRRRL